MRNITFDLSNLHHHGSAFYDYLALRKHFFVDLLKWDIPHDDQVEMDQYDNPLAHYFLVMVGDCVVGGARVMPTTSAWGNHTYMLGDAIAGKLPDIPKMVLPTDIANPQVWECTRLVISDRLTTKSERSECLFQIVSGLVDVAEQQGATKLISLSPISLQRALRQLGFAASRLGEPYKSAEDGRKYAVLTMPTMQSARALAAELSTAA